VKNKEKIYDPKKANSSQVLKKYLDKSENHIISKNYKRLTTKKKVKMSDEEKLEKRISKLSNFDDSSSSDPDATQLEAITINN
jgi:hypothetical protein